MPSYCPEDYHVGIITALPKELTAVLATLDEEHAAILGNSIHDDNSYVLGKLGVHNVVAACLPAGVYGTTSATVVCKNMLAMFPQLRFGLLVGIGGGIPNLKAGIDIRLGDVVVGQPDQGHSGVIQYDLGKRHSDGRFQRGRDLNRPPTALLTALATLRARTGLGESPIPEYIRVIDEKHPSLRDQGYCYQGSAHDYLQCARCDTSGWWWILWLILFWVWPFPQCEYCDHGRIRRPLRTKIDPVVHYGTIASGNTLLRNASIRDQLRDDCGAMCVEMEAAGVVELLPCIVIRGICDYADAQKNDMWQQYASLTAAAFAKQLLGYISPQMTEQEKPILTALAKLDQYFRQQEAHNIIQEIHQKRDENFRQQQAIRDLNDKLEACHQIFKTSDYEGQKNINPNAVAGTCHWVLDHPQYRSWLASATDNLLWISADPGCGKSVLSKLLIDQYLPKESASGPITVCYFFFKDNEQQNSLHLALCAILHQLFRSQPELIRHAVPAFQENGANLQRDEHELWRILQHAAEDSETGTIIVIFDALDECRDKDRKRLIDFISQTGLRKSSRSALKWLVTSRPYDDIRDQFDSIPPNLSSIRLRGEDESDQVQAEINLVIRQRMQELSRDLSLSPKKTEEVMQQLLSMEHRTYLWLHLAINEVKKSFRRALRPSDQVIPLVPASVDDAYEKILSRVVDGTEKHHAKMVLTIVVGARRPLTIPELALALDLATLAKSPQNLSDLTVEGIQLKERIRQWCGLFVLITNGRVYLLHQTAKEFLLNHTDEVIPNLGSWKRCLPVLEVEKRLATICIRYLSLRDFDRDPHVRNAMQPEEVQSFFEFAANHWADHARSVEDQLDEEIKLRMMALYDLTSFRSARWISAVRNDRALIADNRSSRLHLAAYNGHASCLHNFLSESPEDIDSETAKGITGLVLGSLEGHSKVVKTLLDKHATKGIARALSYAVQGGKDTVVRLLIGAGADTNTSENDEDPALVMACLRGQGHVVQTLVDAGADVNVKGIHFGTPLQAACMQGQDSIAQILLNAGADVRIDSSKDRRGNALCIASWQGHEKIVQMLLDHGADANAGIVVASVVGYTRLVEVLLDAGANVDTIHERYGTALQAASAKGHLQVVRKLLEHGSDVNIAGGLYGAAVNLASHRGHADIEQLLFEHGAARPYDGICEFFLWADPDS